MAASDLAKMVPGFEFLQTLMKGASSVFPGVPGVPGMGQWIAPTLDPAELDKRIQELRTVQFWLEQNARLLGTTVQALEVQRMTLSTLQTMNLPAAELRDALTIKPQATSPAQGQPQEGQPEHIASPAAADAARPGVPAIDPLQWWGALTQQFTDLAAHALKDSGPPATPGVATDKPKPKPETTGLGKRLKRAASQTLPQDLATGPAAVPAPVRAKGRMATGSDGEGLERAVGRAAALTGRRSEGSNAERVTVGRKRVR